MGRAQELEETVKTKTLGVKLQPEQRLRIFANLIIDRILEDQAKGTLADSTNNKKT